MRPMNVLLMPRVDTTGSSVLTRFSAHNAINTDTAAKTQTATVGVRTVSSSSSTGVDS